MDDNGIRNGAHRSLHVSMLRNLPSLGLQIVI